MTKLSISSLQFGLRQIWFISCFRIRVLNGSIYEKTFEFSGGSLEDYTRIASSDPTMWKDIFVSNRSNIISSIEEFEVSLTNLKQLIQE